MLTYIRILYNILLTLVTKMSNRLKLTVFTDYIERNFSNQLTIVFDSYESFSVTTPLWELKYVFSYLIEWEMYIYVFAATKIKGGYFT